jgi:lipoate-protein ligase A
MAIDEALLIGTDIPVLRIYRWDGPWVSIGCFVPRPEAEAAFPGRPLVRRWTGGGIVDHAGDWTYSMILPRDEPLATLGTAGSYRIIHGALARALTACGLPADLADAPQPGRGGLCFEAPVLADVVSRGRKIAGAAQRRTRHGLLHQGSLQGIEVPDGLREALAAELHARATRMEEAFSEMALQRAGQLVRERYGQAHWLDRDDDGRRRP